MGRDQKYIKTIFILGIISAWVTGCSDLSSLKKLPTHSDKEAGSEPKDQVGEAPGDRKQCSAQCTSSAVIGFATKLIPMCTYISIVDELKLLVNRNPDDEFAESKGKNVKIFLDERFAHRKSLIGKDLIVGDLITEKNVSLKITEEHFRIQTICGTKCENFGIKVPQYYTDDEAADEHLNDEGKFDGSLCAKLYDAKFSD